VGGALCTCHTLLLAAVGCTRALPHQLDRLRMRQVGMHMRVLDTPIMVRLVGSRFSGAHVACCIVHVASCMVHVACCMLHRAWQLVGSRSVGCTCAGLGSASEDEARRGRAWRGKRQGAARPVGCAGEVSAHEGRPSMHMPAALPIGIPPALVIARARSIQRGARGQSALSCLNSVPWV
jgi:hypothetical protein